LQKYALIVHLICINSYKDLMPACKRESYPLDMFCEP
jgi:hypothetical protein